jgi:hypothetical protein
MSVIESLHVEHKQRLARMRPRPVVSPPKFEAAPRRSAYLQDDAYELAWHLEMTDNEPPAHNVTVEAIKRAVCNHFLIDHTTLISARRPGYITLPRHIAYYLARTLTLRSLPEIGRRMGGRDHTTILHGANKIAAMIKQDENLQETITKLTWQLGGRDISSKRKPKNRRVFNDDVIRSIRACRDTQDVIAERYNVSRGLISNIKTRRAWGHVA